MSHDLSAALWPVQRLGEGLQALAASSGLRHEAVQALQLPAAVAPPGHSASTSSEWPRWIEWAAQQMALQAEPVQCMLPETTRMLRRAAPALLMLQGPHAQAGLQFVLLLGRRGGQLQLLGPDGRVRHCPVHELRSLVCASQEAPLQADINSLLATAGVPSERQARARQALLDERLSGVALRGAWLLRQPATSGLWQQLAQLRVPRRVGGMLALFGALYALEIAGWRLIGQAALDGRLDWGWLTAWVLMLLTLVPLQLLSSAINQGLALDLGTALRQRLLAGALRMDLDVLRRQGSGQLLARVLESQALESAGLAGALGLGVALLELAFAAWVLMQGAAPALHTGLLLLWLALLVLLAWRNYGHLLQWTEQRLEMTHGLVERMMGHRTRLAQEHAERRSAEEDHELNTYLNKSTALDRSLLPVVALAPGGWIWLSLLVLAPSLVSDPGAVNGWAGSADAAATPATSASGAAALAISLGGILFAHRALAGVSGGLGALARAAVAWRQAAPLFKAGAAEPLGTPFLPSPAAPEQADALVDAQGLSFAYRSGSAPVLQGASLQIGAHDRVLLAGPSGSGKSTLAALLVGLRLPSAGLLLMGGLDRATLGEQWHRWATEAPQFHDNHIFTGTLAFNLLMGREWPPSPAALAEAQALCEELGLGPLLQRMPAGLQQRVGESGWQLSHGEHSRVFLARALLQRAPLTVLDESFAALDPQTLHRCLRCALQRTRALVVIAHP